MNPEIEQLRNEVEELRKIIDFFVKPDRYIFQRNVEIARNKSIIHNTFAIADGGTVPLGTSSGAKFGTASNQKIGFLGATPIPQQAAITQPSGGATIDTQARNAISALIVDLQAFGFLA